MVLGVWPTWFRVFGESVSGEDHLGVIRENVAMVSQAKPVEALFNCV